MASGAVTDLGRGAEVVLPRAGGPDVLRSGDHLDRRTFHERYLAMPPEFHAELVDGVVYVSSPTSPQHGHPHNNLAMILGVYEVHTPGTRAYNNTTVYPSASSELQPDDMLIVLPEYGGRMRQEGTNLIGGPEFIAEVAYSSEAYDLHSKLREYERAGVMEYFVVLLRERQVRFFKRRVDHFDLQSADDGNYRSEVFPGLWLNATALVEGEAAQAFSTLQQGLATAEHAEFVRQLLERRP